MDIKVVKIIAFLYSSKIYSTNSSKMMGNVPKVVTSTGYFSNSTSSSVTSGRFSMFITLGFAGKHAQVDQLGVYTGRPYIQLNIGKHCNLTSSLKTF